MKTAFALTEKTVLIACAHCKVEFFPRNPSDRFCCHGCEQVFGLIHSQGLNAFYKLRDENPPNCPLPAQVSSENFAYFDDPEVINRFAKNNVQMEFFIEGLNCTACLWLLEKLPSLCKDVVLCEVNFAKSIVRITKTESGSFRTAAEALNRLGYRPHLIGNNEAAAELRKMEQRQDLIRIGTAAFCTGNIMLFSVSIYGGADGKLGQQFHWVIAALALPVLTFSAWPFYKSALGSLRAFSINLDVPIVAALIAGIAMSFRGIVVPTPFSYFDSLSMLVLLLLSSRIWLKSLQQRHLDSSQLEDSLLTGTVSKLDANGAVERVSALSLETGDELLIEEARLIPTDGRVSRITDHSARCFVQTAALTGESYPIELKLGDSVFAGSEALSGSWVLEVSAPAAESRLAGILREASRAVESKPAVTLFADRVGRYFVGIILAFAATLCLWSYFYDPAHLADHFSHALALIIVTCPCVFGMAIPLSISLAIKAAARRGILIKNGDAIEKLNLVESVYFDKTGTLTVADLQVVSFEYLGTSLHRQADLAALLAIETDGAVNLHPVAKCLTRYLKQERLPLASATGVRAIPTRGVEGIIENRKYSVVNIARIASKLEPLIMSYECYRGDSLFARFELGDSLRDEASEALNLLRSRSLDVHLLSGDQKFVVEQVSRSLNIPPSHAVSSASPELKAQIVADPTRKAVMVGDGANDSLALASATVGIAVRGSMEVSLKTADVYLLRADLRVLNDLFEIAHKTKRAINRNLIFSATFNIVAGTLAVTGHMQPLWAAVFMPLSSLTVLLSALATGRKL
ncbi:MAG: heavy metal translocating P-type ATPase [Proteobacteria bacterium]|nr:MAG: heavy metal translocating P-type ATPase [Pseudomonadota bacterium]